jgi:mxaJ protein
MSLVCSDWRPARSVAAALVAAGPLVFASGSGASSPLGVCADPNNLPFSNQLEQGFENRIARVIAGELHRPVVYFWAPQRRGFIRNTLAAGHCDVVIGVPAEYGLLQPTRAYYRSSYAFVSRTDRHLSIRSFDDPRLKTMTIGIQIVGEDYNNPPAAQALAMRHIVNNVRGFSVYGDYSQPDPQRAIVDAVAKQQLDLAIVWGPQAGFFARHQPVAMQVTPIEADTSTASLPMAFDIAMGVRRDDRTLLTQLNAVIDRRLPEIRRILTDYGVPLQ